MRARITLEIEVANPSAYLDEYSDVPKTDEGVARDLAKYAIYCLRKDQGTRNFVTSATITEVAAS